MSTSGISKPKVRCSICRGGQKIEDARTHLYIYVFFLTNLQKILKHVFKCMACSSGGQFDNYRCQKVLIHSVFLIFIHIPVPYARIVKNDSHYATLMPSALSGIVTSNEVTFVRVITSHTSLYWIPCQHHRAAIFCMILLVWYTPHATCNIFAPFTLCLGWMSQSTRILCPAHIDMKQTKQYFVAIKTPMVLPLYICRDTCDTQPKHRVNWDLVVNQENWA